MAIKDSQGTELKIGDTVQITHKQPNGPTRIGQVNKLSEPGALVCYEATQFAWFQPQSLTVVAKEGDAAKEDVATEIDLRGDPTFQAEPGSPQNPPKSPQKRYLAAAHAMQTGVASKIEYDPAETTPKHLRVGVNSALVNDQALADLLIKKGIITREEYVASVAECMEAEVKSYEAWLSEHLKAGITLG